MNLAIISRVRFTYNGDKYLTHRLEGKYIDGLASHFDHIILCVPVVKKGVHSDYFIYSGYEYELRSDNVTIWELPAPSQRQLSVLEALKIYLRITRALIAPIRHADLVYIAMPNPRGILAFLTCKVLLRPFFVYLGGDWAQVVLHNSRWTNHHLRRILIPMYLAIAGIFGNLMMRGTKLGLVHGTKLREKYDDGSGRIVAIGPLLDISENDMVIRSDTSCKTQLKILYVGSLAPVKGVSYLVEAMPKVIERLPESHILLELVGPGEQEHLRQQARELRIEERVIFRGYIGGRDELLGVYADADIFVLPSLSEGFPKVIYEAMSQSLPVVATRVGGIPGVLNHGRTALLVRPGSSDDLADAIFEIITNPLLRQRLIASGRELFRRVISGNPVVQTIEGITHRFPQFTRNLK